MNTSSTFSSLYLNVEKPRTLEIQSVKGKAVVGYIEPLTTQQMRDHRLSPLANNSSSIILSLDLTICAFVRDARKFIKLCITLASSHDCRIVYGTIGFTEIEHCGIMRLQTTRISEICDPIKMIEDQGLCRS